MRRKSRVRQEPQTAYIVEVPFPYKRSKRMSDEARSVLARALRVQCVYRSPLAGLLPDDIVWAGRHIVRGLCAALDTMAPLYAHYTNGDEVQGVVVWEHIVADNAMAFWQAVLEGAPTKFVGVWFRAPSYKQWKKQCRRAEIWEVMMSMTTQVVQFNYQVREHEQTAKSQLKELESMLIGKPADE